MVLGKNICRALIFENRCQLVDVQEIHDSTTDCNNFNQYGS